MAVANHPTLDHINVLNGEWYSTQPHEDWTWMRKNAPIYYDAKSNTWAIMRHKDILEIEKNPKIFSSKSAPRPHLDHMPMMISMDDPEHLWRRRLLNKGFTPNQVKDKEVEIENICNDIIDKICEKGECDFVWDLAAPLPLILIGNMLGFPRSSYDDLLEWSDDMIRGTPPADQEAMEKAMMAGIAFREFQLEVIKDRRGKELCPDLVSILCHAEQDGEKLDDESLIQETLLILIGGDETTRHVISRGMLALMQHPDQRQKFVDNLYNEDYMIRAVEEILRWVTPIQNMSRTVMEDTEINGQKLEKDEELILMYPSANRDEEVFEDPFTFNIEREPNAHIAFGFGTHFCLGSSLARLELKIMFERLFSRIGDIELATDDPLPFRASNFIVGPEAMPVKFTPSAKLN